MTLTLTLKTPPEVPLEAEVLCPDKLAGLDESEVARQQVLHGNRKAAIGDFFSVSGRLDGELRLVGDLGLVKRIGLEMTRGRVVVDGKAGAHAGRRMSGGEIVIEGDAGDWVGAEMIDGRILVKGNAGHMVGAASRGSDVGMRGGRIVILGGAGNEIGNAMRAGMIAIGGDTGDFIGVNMLAGSIFVFGAPGWRAGAGMKRGTIVSMQPVEMLPTFTYACTYRPNFLRLYLLRLRELGLPVDDAHITGKYQRWSGDSVELNRGEALLFEG